MNPIMMLIAIVLFPAPDPVQYMHRGPLDPVQIDPGHSSVVTLELGHHGGLIVDLSAGVVSPACDVVAASAHVVADGPVRVHIDIGPRWGAWNPVVSADAPGVPMTPVRMAAGHDIRLRVENTGHHRITVDPLETRFNIYAAACARRAMGGQFQRAP